MNLTEFLEDVQDWKLVSDCSAVNVRTLKPEPRYSFNEYVCDNPVYMMETAYDDSLLATARSLRTNPPDPVRQFLLDQESLKVDWVISHDIWSKVAGQASYGLTVGNSSSVHDSLSEVIEEARKRLCLNITL